MRHDDWSSRLDLLIEAYRLKAFAWGSCDCFTLVRDAIARQSDVSIWPEIRYGDWQQAARHLRRHGFYGVGDALAAVLPEIHHARAQRGDVGTTLTRGGDEAGVVVLGNEIAGMAAEGGLCILPRGHLFRAFRVG